jgi:hypothetical protein
MKTAINLLVVKLHEMVNRLTYIQTYPFAVQDPNEAAELKTQITEVEAALFVLEKANAI